MKQLNIFTTKQKRTISSILIFILSVMLFLPYLPSIRKVYAKAKPDDKVVAYGEGFHHYCIDDHTVVSNGAMEAGDVYTYVLPSTVLSDTEKAYLFWAILSLEANFGTSPDVNNAVNKINYSAPKEGLKEMKPYMTEADLKLVIHSAATRANYPWLDTAVQNAEKYMQLGGILGAGSGSQGGGIIPSILENRTSLSNAYKITSENSFTIQFDPSGADMDFIASVPIEFSTDGETFSPDNHNGWTYVKTEANIQFSNPNPEPPKIFVRFNPDGTKYASNGSYASIEEAYETALEIWVCTKCCGTHRAFPALTPVKQHQRLAFLELETVPVRFYASIGGSPIIAGGEAGMEFQVYRHEEDMKSSYNVQLYKYDYETGQPLVGAKFDLYERFDDKDQIDTVKDGPVHIYKGGAPYASYHTGNPVIWDDFRKVTSVITDSDGHAGSTVNRGYHYEKTFCDGHPSPVFAEVPEPELEASEPAPDGSVGEDIVINKGEIEAAQAANMEAARQWLACVSECEDKASGDFEGVHFHWIMNDVDRSVIEDTASTGGGEGGTPDGGITSSAEGETAFEESGCRQDRDETHEKFISLKYSYTFRETTAREGFIRHNIHPEDIPIEVITTDASEHGANSSFAGCYDTDIKVNDAINYTPAREILESREQTFLISEAVEKEEKPNLYQRIATYLQQIISYFSYPKGEGGGIREPATPSDAEETDGEEIRTASNADVDQENDLEPESYVQFSSPVSRDQGFIASAVSALEIYEREAVRKGNTFDSAYQDAMSSASKGEEKKSGPSGNYSHCNNADEEGNAWRIYDHRTEGDIHINKKDMELETGEADDYTSYGDTQGDATLEGAVYGLFAAQDILHPDGKTGIIYRANNLVAAAATDKNGDASFLVNTEAPGYTYDYAAGSIVKTSDSWADTAPENLYTGAVSYDDYTADKAFARTYYDNRGNNGNSWIGRPLLMGDYYIKELTRSEGYELSISNRQHDITNHGQDTDVTVPQGTGYTVISQNLYAEAQISGSPTGEVGDPDVDELFFTAKSQGTGDNGFDLVLDSLSPDTKIYRKDTGTKIIEVEVGTGTYEKVFLTNPDGSPQYLTAEHDYQYPKYNQDGSFQTKEIPTDYHADGIPMVYPSGLDETKVLAAIEKAEPSMSKEEIASRLSEPFDENGFDFVKGKLEAALRQNGKMTPAAKNSGNGTYEYSTITSGIYDRGLREGEPDHLGLTGVFPGDPAAYSVYGSPVQTVELPKTDDAGRPVTIGEAILSLADFYNTHACYTYGGMDAMEETQDRFVFTLYIGVKSLTKTYMAVGSNPVDDSIIYHAIPYIPQDSSKCPRWIYAAYSNNPGNHAFGTYSDVTIRNMGSSFLASAALVTDAIADKDGSLVSKLIEENVYFQTGERVLDKDGNPIQAFKYREIMEKRQQETETSVWTQLPASSVNGQLVSHVDSTYTDAFGNAFQDDVERTYSFRAVVPEKSFRLTGADIGLLGVNSGWSVGDLMGGAFYYAAVKHAKAKAYLSYDDTGITGDNSYVRTVSLVYPTDADVRQDGDGILGTNTRENPVKVQERIIKQKVKVTKNIQDQEEEDENNLEKMDNFRFKIYLESNLARLYRDEVGRIVWQDRKGNEVAVDDNGTIKSFTAPYPALAQSIYTKVSHRTEPLYQNSNYAAIANRSLYSHDKGVIKEEQNPGYTAVLEAIENQTLEDGTILYNYEKFFDAIAVANRDKWDDHAPGYTSWRPIGNEANRSDFSIENARVSDQVRQFAIDWYLKDEVKKLVCNRNDSETAGAGQMAAYTDELYDEALDQAVIKAENYLKPFFAYDLDAIYAIEWDSAKNGGRDHDKTTLSADMLQGEEETDSAGYYYGVSEYLPYGTYVIAEQQPRYAELEDLPNRHYRTDSPKRISLPEVYEDGEASQNHPEALNRYYEYPAADTPEELASKYKIRFQEESGIIKARNYSGDFEVFKYGLSLPHLKNGAGTAGAGDYFALTQAEYKPCKNYYNDLDDRTAKEVEYYLSEGQSGRKAVSEYYRYSSVAEMEGSLGGKKSMTGMQTAVDGSYAPMLVPWSVAEPVRGAEDFEGNAAGESSYQGYGYRKFRNTFYRSRLRLEKLDAETHENILHDSAIFKLYTAERDDRPGGTGQVKFYEKDTAIIGSREFLAAMGASRITPLMRHMPSSRLVSSKRRVPAGSRTLGAGVLCSGLVPAKTPICKEENQVTMRDGQGNKVGEFKAFTTTRDGKMKDQETNSILIDADQNAGYLETPQPLNAGAYVLCEVKPPSGYIPTKPLAVEVYSDGVTYYKEGDKDRRAAAVLYEYGQESPSHSDTLAQINVENAPIKLTVEKVKEPGVNSPASAGLKTVTYKVSGRIDGSLAQIGSNPDYEYAYENGDYLGYAWKKGTLEYLKARKDAGEEVDIVYHGRSFAGYGYVTKPLETADDVNPYVAGAVMTLFDAIQITPSGDREDHAFEGLAIERSATGNVTRMYVRQGSAGDRTEMLREVTDDGIVWTAKTVERPDTDILYYDLDSLDLFQEEMVDGRRLLYGYDKQHRKLELCQLGSDQGQSIFAFKGGVPCLEFEGGDFTKIVYSPKDKILTVGEGTKVYHIDREGNRDAQVDPYTGMAYVLESSACDEETPTKRVLVWPVSLARDEFGNVIARDKITTSRIATVGENRDGSEEHVVLDPVNHSGHEIPDGGKPSYDHTESGYITGSWHSDHGEESHQESTITQNQDGQSLNGEVLISENNGTFAKELNPVFDPYGLAQYYQRSGEIYSQETELYDRSDIPVREKDSDHRMEYDAASYITDFQPEAPHEKRPLYHRQGEGYVLENTWITSDRTPNDPFQFNLTDGQADCLKRVPAGTYIMEELRAPEGYVKGMPVGITVKAAAVSQTAAMTDKTIKTELTKVDGTDHYTYQILDMNHQDQSGQPAVIGTSVEGKGRYHHKPLEGAVLALYEADRVYTSDWEKHPGGWYLEKISPDAEPFQYLSTDSTPSNPIWVSAIWTTAAVPIYLEGLPEGDYILEEQSVPPGYVKSAPLEVHITNTSQVQVFTMTDDHTKVEVEKYILEEGEKSLKNGAGFALYEAKTDQEGNVLYEDGLPQYHKDRVIDSWVSEDAFDYTETVDVQTSGPHGQPTAVTGFMMEFEAMYKQFGTAPGTAIRWPVKRSAKKNTESQGVWMLEDGRRVVESDGNLIFPSGIKNEEREAIRKAWTALQPGAGTMSWLEERSAAYVTHTQTEQGTCFPITAQIQYRTDRGEDIKITVYQEAANRQGRTFTFEYQFDYRRLEHVNGAACSYLTEEGRRRFDYLPAGANYVLVETKAPVGCEKAKDRLIQIKSTEHVQRHSIENREGELLISKTGPEHGPENGPELSGAKLALYCAAENGTCIEDASLLRDVWISGSDGVYSEEDAVNNRIPQGYQKGDLRPHVIRGLEEGIYYVVELESPPYYARIEPIRFYYHWDLEPVIIRATDHLLTGELEIIKQSVDGAGLTGVVFEINAYRQDSREPVWTAKASDTDGVVRVRDMPVGEPGRNGRINPYTYQVREVIPPEGYAVDTELHTFQFAPAADGTGNTVKISLTVQNEKTKLYIGKRQFGNLPYEEECFVEGALLAIYELHGRKEDGSWIYDPVKDLAASWLTSKEERSHLIEGLKGEKSYLLKELQAPDGYGVMDPVVFTVSQDGRSITHVTDQLGAVGIDMTMDLVTVEGRYAARVDMVLSDEAGQEVIRWTAVGDDHVLTRSDGIIDGGIYALTEHTVYSDGTDQVTGRCIRRIHLDDAGECRLKNRKADFAELSVLTEEGIVIQSFVPKETIPKMTIENPVRPEPLEFSIHNRNTKEQEGIRPSKEVLVSIHYRNTELAEADLVITAQIDAACRILDLGGGVAVENGIQWKLDGVAAGKEGDVAMVLEVVGQTSDQLCITAALKGGKRERTAQKTVPIQRPNRLVLFHQMTGSGAIEEMEVSKEFKVRLYHENGEELLGTFAYEGSQSGVLKSGDRIALAGNESIIISPGTVYNRVEFLVEDMITGEQRRGVIDQPGACAMFTSEVPDLKDRLIFTKGERYLLKETTVYTDGQSRLSGQWSFSVNESGEVQGMTVYDRRQQVSAVKIDETTGAILPGAVLQLWDDSGKLLEEWETTTSPYELQAILTPGVLYRIRERAAPEGYLLMKEEDEVTFQLTQDDAILMFLVDNRPDTPPIEPPDEPEKLPEPKPEYPDIPRKEPPDKEEVIEPFPLEPKEDLEKEGMILAFYEPSAICPEGLKFRSPGWHLPWAKTGEDEPYQLYYIIFALSAVGALIILIIKKK